MKSISCPHCQKIQDVESLRYDKNLDMLCQFCNKVAFAVTEEEEGKIKLINFTVVYSYKKELLPIVADNRLPLPPAQDYDDTYFSS